MGGTKADADTTQSLVRQAEILESRLDHLLATWDQTLCQLSRPQSKDLIESLRDAALDHRMSMQQAMRLRQTKKN